MNILIIDIWIGNMIKANMSVFFEREQDIIIQ